MILSIKIHSFVDVITNSSSTIYNYQEDALPAVKNMIDEFLKTFGCKETADDMFYPAIMSSIDHYSDYLDDTSEDPDEDKIDKEIPKEMSRKELELLIENIITGKIEKPEWIKNADEQEDGEGFEAERFLYLVPKEEKYKKLGEAIIKFLNSPTQEATYG